jgi:hypothetical protein
MSTAIQLTYNLTQWTVGVKTGETATRGYAAVWDGTGNHAKDPSADSDEFFGIFDSTVAGGDGVQVTVNLFAPVVRVKVGTGGATRGKKGMWSAGNDGWTDAPAQAAGGATENNIYVMFMQTGTVGDTVGAQLITGNRIST